MFSASDFIFFQAVSAAFVAARLLQLRLVSRFPAFFSYLLLVSVVQGLLSRFPPASFTYFYIYMYSRPLYWVASFFAVREVLSLVFRDYPGIRTMCRWATWFAVGVACVVLLLVKLTLKPDPHHSRSLLYYVELVTQSLDISLALPILFVLAVLSRYPLHLRPSTFLSSVCFSAIFFADGLANLMGSLSRYLFNATADALQIKFAIFCFAAWGLLLKTEPAVAPVRTAVPDAKEEELLHQLAALNQLLGRAGQR